MTLLTYLYANDNSLTGAGADLLTPISHSVLGLDLSVNLFSGTIPFNTAGYSLVDLYLRGCLFGGSIPTELQTLQNIQNLDISDNTLFGTLPTEMNSVGTVYDIDVVFVCLCLYLYMC